MLQPYPLSQEESDALQVSAHELQGVTIRKGVGCEQCRGTGYWGRTAIFELMRMTDDIRSLIHKSAPAHLIRSADLKGGMQTLRDSAITKFKAGIISVDEVFRITGSNKGMNPGGGI